MSEEQRQNLNQTLDIAEYAKGVLLRAEERRQRCLSGSPKPVPIPILTSKRRSDQKKQVHFVDEETRENNESDAEDQIFDEVKVEQHSEKNEPNPEEVSTDELDKQEIEEDKELADDLEQLSEDDVPKPTSILQVEPVTPIEPLGKRRNLRKLGELFTPNVAYDSPVHRHAVLEKTPETCSKYERPRPEGRSARLGILTSTLKGYDDDDAQFTPRPKPRLTLFNPSPKPRFGNSNSSGNAKACKLPKGPTKSPSYSLQRSRSSSPNPASSRSRSNSPQPDRSRSTSPGRDISTSPPKNLPSRKRSFTSEQPDCSPKKAQKQESRDTGSQLPRWTPSPLKHESSLLGMAKDEESTVTVVQAEEQPRPLSVAERIRRYENNLNP